jgi:hypothetical protein
VPGGNKDGGEPVEGEPVEGEPVADVTTRAIVLSYLDREIICLRKKATKA